MPQISGTLRTEKQAIETSNDYHRLPATDKQLRYARQISGKAGVALPWDIQQDRYRLSHWIDIHKKAIRTTPFSSYPSSKQVAFAERIARQKQRQIPHECFRDRALMSHWIDSNR